MVTRKGIQFQYKRFSGTASRLFKNKMSTVGIILLAGFVFAALAAPLLTPYTPGIVVAGTYAQPAWVTNFPDGYYLSKNMVIVNDPLFNSPSSIQDWTLSAPTSTLANTQVSYAPGVSSRSDSHGSLQMAYSGLSTGVAIISQTFQYPYHGPPGRFIASGAFLLSGVSQANPVHIRLFIQRADGTVFNLLNDNETTNGQWVPPPTTSLDSNSGYLQSALGTFGTGFSAPQIVFSGMESYTYGVEVTFSGPAKINIDDIQLRLLGTAWGLLGSDYGGSGGFSPSGSGAPR